MWVDYRPVDVEIDYDNTEIFYLFEMQASLAAEKLI